MIALKIFTNQHRAKMASVNIFAPCSVFCSVEHVVWPEFSVFCSFLIVLIYVNSD
jgi:hypothetical protein